MKIAIIILVVLQFSCNEIEIKQSGETPYKSEINDSDKTKNNNELSDTSMTKDKFNVYWDHFLRTIINNNSDSFSKLSHKDIIYNGDTLSTEIFTKRYFGIAFDNNVKKTLLLPGKIEFSRFELEGTSPIVLGQLKNPNNNYWIYEVYLDLGLIKTNIQRIIELDFIESSTGFKFIEYKLNEKM